MEKYENCLSGNSVAMVFCKFQGECDPDFGGMFVFDIHAKELIVGEIFVRVYNEQPTFPLEVSIV